jgi:hypothetical protein
MPDLLLDDTGELVLPSQIVRGVAAVEQRLLIRAQVWRGEWLEDTLFGVPYSSWLETKPLEEIRAALVAELAQVPGVVRVAGSTIALDDTQDAVVFDATLSLRDPATGEEATVTLSTGVGAGASRVLIRPFTSRGIVP